MAILVELTYENDTTENLRYPAPILRTNNEIATNVHATSKAIEKSKSPQD